jgi:hypothetical protein
LVLFLDSTTPNPMHWSHHPTFLPMNKILSGCLLQKCFSVAVTRSSLEKVLPPTCLTNHQASPTHASSAHVSAFS